MKFDMHCHTKEGSLDGKVPIEEFINQLVIRGYRGMLVSDHDSYRGYRAYRDMIKGKKYTNFVVLKGIEYDTIDAGHILVIMPEKVKLKILEMRGLPVQLLIEIVHRNGGILGPAHPCGERYLSFIRTFRKKKQLEVMDRFDFIEVFNACETVESNMQAAALARQYHKPGFGGSDAHKLGCIGLGYTEFPECIRCESDLIRYIHEGRPVGAGGVYYRGTVKEKIGWANNFLVQGFWFYNRIGSLWRRHKRRIELHKHGF